MAKGKKSELDISTEERIKNAASVVFTRKGYGAARTRDIAEEAGINLALLNYYFRSKEKLFNIVMADRIEKLFGVLGPVLYDESTTLDEKLRGIADNYITMLTEHPELPIFVLSEIRSNPDQLAGRMQVVKHLTQSVFVKQLAEKRPDVNPIHFLLSLLGMILFPFIGKPVLENAVGGESNYLRMLEQRRTLIPKWAKAMLEAE